MGRQFVLIVQTSMCASHEATQISMMSEFLHYSQESPPTSTVSLPFRTTKAVGCQDGSNLDVMMHGRSLITPIKRRRRHPDRPRLRKRRT
ncbi:MAG: hypothetical protein IPG58_20930 [Acidobacteria bacterium]|nr:hypothetical protein [Acidobacteriota bacterium]